MRDVLAAVIASLLLLVAASLATTLKAFRTRRQRARDAERALGRRLIAEIPVADDLVLFSEDEKRVYYGERAIDKDLIVAVRLLIDGSPIAAYVSRRADPRAAAAATSVEDRPAAVASSRPQAAAVASSPSRSQAREDRRPQTGTGGHSQPQPEGIARDRWDVAIESVPGTTLVECGAIRERVSQELARAVFEAVKAYLERQDAAEPRSHRE
jgi:hypothetical protein